MRYVISNIKLALDETTEQVSQRLTVQLELHDGAITSCKLVRRALDARKRSHVHFVCSYEIEVANPLRTSICQKFRQSLRQLDSSLLTPQCPAEFLALTDKRFSSQHTVVVGAGPAGLFAALALAKAGQRVSLLERGKPVETRMRDIGRLRSRGELNPESNICFGEGGAGTYTDGKLYTRIKHPYVRWVLAEFVHFGAASDILIDAHPHLGTDKLVRIVRRMREHLQSIGVDYRFDARVDALLLQQGKAAGVRLADGEEITADNVVLAIGHSARDTIEKMQAQGVDMQAKDFAVGVRAEHAQSWVDDCQLGAAAEHESLGAAEYKLTHQVQDKYIGKRGVYSFCMCPGGLIVPSPTEHGMMAINGMSNAHRRSGVANSGIVVQVTAADIERQGLGSDALCGIRLQRQLEADCFAMTSTAYAAPAMRISDFVAAKASGQLAPTRFKPSVEAADLHALFPTWLAQPLRQGLLAFDRKMKGFVSDEANLLAVESRTSSPIRLLRNHALQSQSVPGLYPAGEGAGYAGGIVSAAVDGLKVAAAILQRDI